MERETSEFIRSLENVPDDLRQTIERQETTAAISYIQNRVEVAPFVLPIENKYTEFYRCSVLCDIVLRRSGITFFSKRKLLATKKIVSDKLRELRRQLEYLHPPQPHNIQLSTTSEILPSAPEDDSPESTNEPPNLPASTIQVPESSTVQPSKETNGQLDDLLECSICYEQFDRPLQLHCGHTFCSSCVTHMVEQARSRNTNGTLRPSTGVGNVTIACPECRKPTQVPPEGLTVNYRLNDLIERVSKAAIKTEQLITVENACHCESCDGPLSSGVYFTCNSCPTTDFLCSMCAIRKHNGHDVVEKRFISILEVEAAKEDINQQSSRAWRAIDLVEATINQISTDGQTTVLKSLHESADHYTALAAGLETITNETASVLERRKALAKRIADKLDQVASKIALISTECNKGFSTTTKNLIDFWKEIGAEMGAEFQQFMPEVDATGSEEGDNQNATDLGSGVSTSATSDAVGVVQTIPKNSDPTHQ